jgi:DNA-binding response OmpR family regulator
VLWPEILGQYGYTAIEASDGEEALRRARDFQGRIDVVITDAVMPKMNGRVLVEHVRENRPDVRALFVSGHTDADIVDEGALDDRDCFLGKPYTPEALAAKVREILDNPPAA